jgi:hypothetical protein
LLNPDLSLKGKGTCPFFEGVSPTSKVVSASADESRWKNQASETKKWINFERFLFLFLIGYSWRTVSKMWSGFFSIFGWMPNGLQRKIVKTSIKRSETLKHHIWIGRRGKLLWVEKVINRYIYFYLFKLFLEKKYYWIKGHPLEYTVLLG